MIFMIFQISTKLLSQVGHQPGTGKFSRNRNETGVGSNDRSFDASSGKNAPVQNEFRDFPKFSKNYLQGHKKLSHFESANQLHPDPELLLESKALRVTTLTLRGSVALLAEKPCFGSQGGSKIMIFMIFQNSTKMPSQVGHQPGTGKFARGIEIGWEQAQTIDLLMLDPGKIPPSKMNLGIFHNLGKTTPHPIKTSIILKVPTSSTLPPNYSIRAKGSTSQSLYFEPWAEKPFLGARAAWKS